MTKRAILWCGQVRQPMFQRTPEGRLREIGDLTLTTDDFKIQANGLELGFHAALALGIARSEIYACVVSHDLVPRDLRTTPYQAAVDDLQRLIGTIAQRAAPDDALLFVGVNHGLPDGLLTSDAPGDEFGGGYVAQRLTPRALDQSLRLLPGPQVVVVAACFAGVFLTLGERANRAVLVSCGAGDRYFVARQECAWSAFLDELFGAWCGFALSDAIPPEKLPLDAAFARAEARLVDAHARNIPLRAGTALWPP